MKKSTVYFTVSIILICSGVLSVAFISKLTIMPMLGLLLIMTGSAFGKKGGRFYNIEHGNSPDTIFLMSKKQKIVRYGVQGFILISAILLIIWNLYR